MSLDQFGLPAQEAAVEPYYGYRFLYTVLSILDVDLIVNFIFIALSIMEIGTPDEDLSWFVYTGANGAVIAFVSTLLISRGVRIRRGCGRSGVLAHTVALTALAVVSAIVSFALIF